MNYQGKHLNEKRDSIIKYGWMVSNSNGHIFLFKLVKRTPFKYLYYEEIHAKTNMLRAKKIIEQRILENDTDDENDIDDILCFNQIEDSTEEQFYRFRSLTDTLKKL